jgi:hypothetical protein
VQFITCNAAKLLYLLELWFASSLPRTLLGIGCSIGHPAIPAKLFFLKSVSCKLLNLLWLRDSSLPIQGANVADQSDYFYLSNFGHNSLQAVRCRKLFIMRYLFRAMARVGLDKISTDLMKPLESAYSSFMAVPLE